MKIKRVDIVGFKSFVDKVSLDFQEGVTAILGPNGCGKSNIVDAIRWAMGEQNAKNLRGRSMEDIIFGGSERRKPLGMAEVSITFANEDSLGPPAFREYPEIMITRRLHRSGESEYLLNKTPCRLLDISELFMDTGVGARAYSIIEQGKIGMILNAKPEDRRFLIEEAAGVTKFKSRKKSALRKIEATRQNLLRLGDIIAEVRRQLGSLKRQAQRAERFRQFREELRGIEIRFAREKYQELRNAADEAARQEKARQQVQAGVAAQLAEGEISLEEMRLQQSLREKEVARGQENIFHLANELQKVEGRLELGARELDNLLRQRERLAAEREEIAQRQQELEKEEAGLQQSRDGLGAELERENRLLAEGEASLEEMAGREHEANHGLEESRRSLYELLTELSRLGSRQDELLRRIQSVGERSSRSRSEAVVGREQLTQVQAGIAALEGNLAFSRQRQAGLLEERELLQEQLLRLRRQGEENESALLARREEFNRQHSRLESLQQLEKTLDGYGSGIRLLLGDAGFQNRFAGVVADILEVPAHLEIAVEAVLGDKLQTLLAAGPEDIREALEFLRTVESRCSFLLAGNRSSAAPMSDTVQCAGQPLSALVQVRSAHAEAVRHLLARIYLVESLDPYYDCPPPAGIVVVTAAGEIFSAVGEVAGGGRQGLDQGLLHRKREMKELVGRTEQLAGEVTTLQEIRQTLREETIAAEESSREIDAAMHREELKIIDSEKDRQRLQEEEERLLERLEVLSLEDDQLYGEKEELQQQLSAVDQGRKEREAHKEELELSVARAQEEIQLLRRETGVVRERVVMLKVAVASMREREEGSRKGLERLGHLRKDLQGRLLLTNARELEGEEEQARLLHERQRLQTELEVLFRRKEEEKARFDRQKEVFEGAARQMELQEEGLKVLRARVNQAREELAALQLQKREFDLELEHLRQNVGERYRVELDLETAAERDFDRSAAERRLLELRRLIDDIGEVNLTAIDEYRELEERYQFLCTQQEDLRQSLEGLQTAIGKINRTTRKRFRETFDLVNSKFQELFPRLFNGGKAELELTDSEDLLETGIEIIVQPPGKKLQSVNLLSGGEKALTAVALIFSIFMIKPSPFCMLDEVDAPLDDANIGRFNEMVREMSAISQFIIITHSKRTMEVADTLYGITMEEPGISKMVSVRMNDFAA